MRLQSGAQGLLNPYSSGKVSRWGFFYLIASISSVLGHNQLLAQFGNADIGSVTVLVIYPIAKDLFDVEVAQWTGRFMAFFPQMVFWSGAIYKDPAIMLCIALCMYAVLKLNHEFTLRYVVLFVGASLALMTLRFYVFYFVAFAAMGTFVLSQRRGVGGSIGSYVVLIADSLSCAYAVFQGNVGLAYRQRTQLKMFYFILMAAGVVEKRRAQQGTQPALGAPAFQVP